MGQITINPRKLAELIENLTSHKKDLISKNEELVQIKNRMDMAWEGDSQYNDVGRPALQRMIKNNEEVVELLSCTLMDLDSWLGAVQEFVNRRNDGMM